MKPVKKSLLVVASICCLITAGVTYALLSKVTETATNTFSSDRSISLKLREDKWDGFDFNESYPDGAHREAMSGTFQRASWDLMRSMIMSPSTLQSEERGMFWPSCARK